jgi:hypothetical protein
VIVMMKTRGNREKQKEKNQASDEPLMLHTFTLLSAPTIVNHFIFVFIFG